MSSHPIIDTFFSLLEETGDAQREKVRLRPGGLAELQRQFRAMSDEERALALMPLIHCVKFLASAGSPSLFDEIRNGLAPVFGATGLANDDRGATSKRFLGASSGLERVAERDAPATGQKWWEL